MFVMPSNVVNVFVEMAVDSFISSKKEIEIRKIGPMKSVINFKGVNALEVQHVDFYMSKKVEMNGKFL